MAQITLDEIYWRFDCRTLLSLNRPVRITGFVRRKLKNYSSKIFQTSIKIQNLAISIAVVLIRCVLLKSAWRSPFITLFACMLSKKWHIINLLLTSFVRLLWGKIRSRSFICTDFSVKTVLLVWHCISVSLFVFPMFLYRTLI